MPKTTSFTAEQVLEVKEKKDKYPTITNSDLARMCGLSMETTRRMLKGEFDFLLDDELDSSGCDVMDGDQLARAIDIASSDICDVLNHNRSVMSDFAGVASAEQMQLALVYINRQLFTIGHLLAAILDPETKATKTMADHFRAEIKADTINGGKRK